jgi:small subunit ribosomal protein S20
MTHLKQARAVLAKGDSEDAATAVTKAISELDKASSKNVLHPNNASRRKSRLAKKLASLTTGTNT